MVELCELKLLQHDMEWPPDMDQHVANLTFEQSIIDEQSLFSSMAVDPSLISTDSLDMDQLRARCETNKNDYKLTFEDSGQWTQSGLFSSPSKNTTGTSDCSSSNNAMTTWGRLRTDNQDNKRFDVKTNSLPLLNDGENAMSPTEHNITTSQQRPSSLLANFVERTEKITRNDLQFVEGFVDDGRYFDVNDNEINVNNGGGNNVGTSERWNSRQHHSSTSIRNMSRSPSLGNAPNKPRRTFADLSKQQQRNNIAPELKFLALHHEIPTFCQTSISLGEMLKKAKDGILTDYEDKLEYSDINIVSKKKSPDSGLGASLGPSHIEDWGSLAVLLPKNVVDACSFFKSNTSLLTGSPSSSGNCFGHQQMNIEGKKSMDLSSYDMYKKGLLNTWCARNNFEQKETLTTSECQFDKQFMKKEKKLISSTNKLKLHAQELSIIGMPIYNIKRLLVERVVEGVADVARGNGTNNVCVAMQLLLSDGLSQNLHAWDIVRKVTASGRATNRIYEVMIDLERSGESVDSKLHSFFCALLALRSLDGWLSYIVLKENVLNKYYCGDAFFVRCNTAYRSLFWRLIESVELLSVMDAKQKSKTISSSCVHDRHLTSTITTPIKAVPSRIASDSRVPKSSSVPSRLSVEDGKSLKGSSVDTKIMTNTHTITNYCSDHKNECSVRRKSRIPILIPRPRRTLSCTAKIGIDTNYKSNSSYHNEYRLQYQKTAYILQTETENGMLPVNRGERVRVLSTRGIFSRCYLLNAAPGRVQNGLVLTRNLNCC